MNKKTIDCEKLKAKLNQVTTENASLSLKLKNISKDYDRLMKSEEEAADYYLKESKKLG